MFVNNKSINDAKVYTDIQHLRSLHAEYQTHPDLVKKEVSQQFESLMVQMLLKSMRDANKEFTSELSSGDQTDFYSDLFDKQLSLELSKSGMGLSKPIEGYIDRRMPTPMIPPPMPSQMPSASFQTAADFVKQLWTSAKEAASLIGADPKLLLAQAALETNWGKQIIKHPTGDSTHNLFNIKADKSWIAPAATFHTLEQRDGVITKQPATFRSYASYADSFKDYAQFLKSNTRYQEALQQADNPQDFIQSLQQAHYATDENYSNKVMSIFSSKKFNTLFHELNLT